MFVVLDVHFLALCKNTLDRERKKSFITLRAHGREKE
jgi:hypothetical protein